MELLAQRWRFVVRDNFESGREQGKKKAQMEKRHAKWHRGNEPQMGTRGVGVGGYKTETKMEKHDERLPRSSAVAPPPHN